MDQLSQHIIFFILGAVVVALWFLANIHFQNTYFGFKKNLPIELYQKTCFCIWFLLMFCSPVGFASMLYYGYIILRALGLPFNIELRFVECLMIGFGCMMLSSFIIGKWKQKQFFLLVKDDLPQCDQCGYILKGLPKLKGRIRCPECGHSETIRSIALRWRHEKKSKKNIEENPI